MKSIILFFISLFIINTSYAGVIISGTRVIYNEGNKNVSINVKKPRQNALFDPVMDR